MSIKKLSLLLTGIFAAVALTGAGCTALNSGAKDAALQGTWSTSQEDFGATVAMAMTFNNGAWEFVTSFEPSQELIDSLNAVEEEATAEAEGTETVEETPELTAESMTMKANYTVDSVENNVFQLTLTGFTADASNPELLEGFDTAEVESELGKLTVDASTEGEITVTPQGGTEEDALTLTKE